MSLVRCWRTLGFGFCIVPAQKVEVCSGRIYVLSQVWALNDTKIKECIAVAIGQPRGEIWNEFVKMITDYAALISCVHKFMA